jgi:hypothetical protein
MTIGEPTQPGDPPASPSENRVVLVVCWVVDIAALLLLGFVLLAVVPKMTQVFADFGTRLPTMTVAVIRLASSPTQVMIGLVSYLGAQVALVTLSREGRSLILLLFTAVSVVLVVVISIFLYLPFIEIVNAVSGSGAIGE